MLGHEDVRQPPLSLLRGKMIFALTAEVSQVYLGLDASVTFGQAPSRLDLPSYVGKINKK